MKISVTVTKLDGKYHATVTDGTNTSEHDPNVGAGHDAALEAIATHRTAFGIEGSPTIEITITAGAG
jgi:hypothetical protein